MGGGTDWNRIGLGVATGGFSELDRAGIGPRQAVGSGGGGKGGGKGGGPPAAPDFGEAARIQAESSEKVNREQTQANRPNQYNDFGSSEWSQDANGNWTQRSGLNSTLAGAAQGLEGQVRDNAGRPVMTGDAARQQAIDAGYSQSSRIMDPQFAQREQALRSDLAAQGLDPGSEAYTKALDNFGRERTGAYGDARDRAIGQGTAAGHTAFADNLAAREAPLAELGTLRGLGTPGSFTAAGSAQPLQSLAAAMQQYSGDLQGYSTQQAGKNSKMNGAAGMGGAALAASDERLKDSIERLEFEAMPGVRFARWKWKDGGSRGFGVVAQDVERVRPDLVTEVGGVKHVNYAGLEG